MRSSSFRRERVGELESDSCERLVAATMLTGTIRDHPSGARPTG